MRVVFSGLGRMGLNMACRSLAAGHEILGHDPNPDARDAAEAAGIPTSDSLEHLLADISETRVVWFMVTAGTLTNRALRDAAVHLRPGDIVVDGANSKFQDSIENARFLNSRGILFLDAGVSGGVWGRERGYCQMIGGDRQAFEHVESLIKALAPGTTNIDRTPGQQGDHTPAELGYHYCGPAGSGHFTKMVHNAIEYGMMQAIAEGLALLASANDADTPKEERFDLDLAAIIELWRRGSVISSWLIDLVCMALVDDPALRKYLGNVDDSGEGRWSAHTAIDRGVPFTVITTALFTRFRSRDNDPFAEKVLSAMRHMFGGHQES